MFRTGFYVPQEQGDFSTTEIKFTLGGELWAHRDAGADRLITNFKDYYYAGNYDSLFKGQNCKDSPFTNTDVAKNANWHWCVKFYDAP